ncbi:uncharacterized protein TNCV_140021 [Trichonephila clavipes]|uniref:Mutator-like transposase domain-containing protein n=1 Tax=Trichonephila clavipes TaxID=2585209 RepID=A0A8X6UZ02_TRICX|nr:uncharacterized protein TNCV_140021 [Trichonephila clavipes]
MQKAASELLVLHPTKNKIVECGISVDGTWQRRGYSSMNGCVAALSVDTGKVVDIEINIMSSYCPTCRKISKMPRSIESETFAADHVCHSNFQGSALKMGKLLVLRESSNDLLSNEALNMHIIMVMGTLRALSVSKILMGRIASQNMNALVMFKIE